MPFYKMSTPTSTIFDTIKRRDILNMPVCFIFTARRYAKRGICRRRVSLCVCVCLSVTLRYSIKTAKRRITQIMPHDTSFLTPKFTTKFELDHPLQGR